MKINLFEAKDNENLKEKLKRVLSKEVADINNYDTEDLTPPYFNMDLTFKQGIEIDNYIGKIIKYAAKIASDVLDDIDEY